MGLTENLCSIMLTISFTYACTIEIQVLMMSNICEDYTDGNKKQVKILPVNSNELALSALLRNNLIARIRG